MGRLKKKGRQPVQKGGGPCFHEDASQKTGVEEKGSSGWGIEERGEEREGYDPSRPVYNPWPFTVLRFFAVFC